MLRHPQIFGPVTQHICEQIFRDMLLVNKPQTNKQKRITQQTEFLGRKVLGIYNFLHFNRSNF